MSVTNSKWFQILKALGPTILTIAVPGLSPAIIPTVVHAIETVESIKGSSGADKKAKVIEVVTNAINVTNSVAKKDVIDPSTTIQAVSTGIDAVVQGVNAVHESSK